MKSHATKRLAQSELNTNHIVEMMIINPANQLAELNLLAESRIDSFEHLGSSILTLRTK